MPTLPCPSPTATSALNEKRRPPFTTLATRLIAITFSTSSLPSPRSCPGPPRPPRSPPAAAAATCATTRTAASATAAATTWSATAARAAATTAAATRTTATAAWSATTAPAWAAAAARAAAAAAGAAARPRTLLGRLGRRCRRRLARCPFVLCHLELQPAFAGSVGHCFHAAVILVTSAVEHDLADAGGLGLLGNLLPNRDRLLALLAREALRPTPSRSCAAPCRSPAARRCACRERNTTRRGRSSVPFTFARTRM